jgi:hypothetical protein
VVFKSVSRCCRTLTKKLGPAVNLGVARLHVGDVRKLGQVEYLRPRTHIDAISAGRACERWKGGRKAGSGYRNCRRSGGAVSEGRSKNLRGDS